MSPLHLLIQSIHDARVCDRQRRFSHGTAEQQKNVSFHINLLQVNLGQKTNHKFTTHWPKDRPKTEN